MCTTGLDALVELQCFPRFTFLPVLLLSSLHRSSLFSSLLSVLCPFNLRCFCRCRLFSFSFLCSFLCVLYSIPTKRGVMADKNGCNKRSSCILRLRFKSLPKVVCDTGTAASGWTCWKPAAAFWDASPRAIPIWSCDWPRPPATACTCSYWTKMASAWWARAARARAV